MPVNKNQQERLKIIDQLFRENRKLKVSEITEFVNSKMDDKELLPVTDRTIRNDLIYIESLNKVSLTKKRGEYYYEDPNDSIDKFAINDEEKDVLDIAKKSFSVFKGSPLFEQFDEISTRILGGSVLRSLNSHDSNNYIQIGELNNDNGVKWLHIIYRAIIEKKALSITYKPFGKEAKIRTISPYVLKEYKNKWYLVAYAREITDSGSTNLFKLSRIEKIEQTDSPYFIDKNFNAEYYFKYSLGIFHSHDYPPELIRLKLYNALISLVKENPIHETMKTEKETDEYSIVTIYVYNTLELENLIFSFGENCEVLSPLNLRNKIKNKVNLLQKIYS
jgi:predicted DNA-binding transcriptional regulator YafY